MLQALTDDPLDEQLAEVSVASLLSLRLLNLEASLASNNRQITAAEVKPTESSEVKLSSCVEKMEAQMQHLNSDYMRGKENHVTYIAHSQSQCSFVVLDPKTKGPPGWIMTEGGLGRVRLDGLKLMGFHEERNPRSSAGSISFSDVDLYQKSHMADVGSYAEAMADSSMFSDEGPIVKYIDKSEASGVVDFVWLNFASPANRDCSEESVAYSANMSRDVSDLSLDYNLLTTGTFTVTAWLRQFDAVKQQFADMTVEAKMRSCSVLTAALYLFVFEPERPDFDLRPTVWEYEHYLQPLSVWLRNDLSVRTMNKLIEKLPTADVAVFDYTLTRNTLSLEALHRALYVMCESLVGRDHSISHMDAHVTGNHNNSSGASLVPHPSSLVPRAFHF